MKFFGIKKDGKAKIFRREDMDLFISSLEEGQHIMISIDKQKRERSIDQNSYLHLLFGLLKDELNAKGATFTLEKVKDLCKAKFLLQSEYIDGYYIGDTLQHTSDLSVEEMSEFIERIKAWAAEFDIYLPDAGEQLETNL